MVAKQKGFMIVNEGKNGRGEFVRSWHPKLTQSDWSEDVASFGHHIIRNGFSGQGQAGGSWGMSVNNSLTVWPFSVAEEVNSDLAGRLAFALKQAALKIDGDYLLRRHLAFAESRWRAEQLARFETAGNVALTASDQAAAVERPSHLANLLF